MSKVIRLSDSDYEIVNSCLNILNSQEFLVYVCGFKPDPKFVISAALNHYEQFLYKKLKED